MKSKSFVRGGAALLATLTLMSGKLSAVQPAVSQPAVSQPVMMQPVMMQPVMNPVQQLNVKEQMMLQNNAADNQIALQNNNADNIVKVQNNYFKNMKDYRDSDPFTKWTLRLLGGLGVATVADEGVGWYSTKNPLWLFAKDEENLNAARLNDCEKMYTVANKVAKVVGCCWTSVYYFLKILADAADRAH